MSKFQFVEPAGESSPPVDVYVTNPDHVQVILSGSGNDERFIAVSFWQLARIVARVRKEYAFQLDREEAEAERVAKIKTN